MRDLGEIEQRILLELIKHAPEDWIPREELSRDVALDGNAPDKHKFTHYMEELLKLSLIEIIRIENDDGHGHHLIVCLSREGRKYVIENKLI